MGKFTSKVSVGIVRDVTQVASSHKVAKMPGPAKSPNTTHGTPKIPRYDYHGKNPATKMRKPYKPIKSKPAQAIPTPWSY